MYVDDVVVLDSTSRPLLINRDPGPDEENVPITWPIALEIVDTDIYGVDRSVTRIWVNGVLAFEGGEAPELKPGFDGPRSEVVESSDTLRIVLDLAIPFQSEATIEVRVVSATNDGQLLDETYYFTAEDLTSPRLLAAQAFGQKKIRLSFDEPVIVADPFGFYLQPLDLPAVVPSINAATANGEMVELWVDTEMTRAVRYQITVTGITDLYSNPIIPPFDAAFFTGYLPPKPAQRRFDLWSMLPVYNRRDDITGDLWRFISCLQEVNDLILTEVDRFSDIFDLERAPEPFLDLILQDLGNPFPFDLDELGKRRLSSVLVEMYRQKGTAIGIKNAIRFFLGIDVTAVNSFAGTSLILGESELGIDWELGPGDKFALYAFDIAVNRVLTEIEREQIRQIVNAIKPAHTHFISLNEPFIPEEVFHWEIGLSEIGTETDLH